jgi:hypothetical protein
MANFCNQCGKRLQDGELCTCEKATERRLKSLPNSSPIQVDVEQEDIQDIEEIEVKLEVEEKIETETKVEETETEETETEKEVEIEKKSENESKIPPEVPNIIHNRVVEPAVLENFPPVISGIKGERQEQITEELEVPIEAIVQPLDMPIEQPAEILAETPDLLPEEESQATDPEAYREAVEKADPINVHNSSRFIKSQISRPIMTPYLKNIKDFFVFIIDSFKNPSDILSTYVKEGSNIKAILLIVIEAILGASLVTIILANVKKLITNMVAEIFLLTGYSEQFPLVRGFFLTVGLMLMTHIIFGVILDIFKSLNIGKYHNTMCISSVRAIATIPFLIIGNLAALVHPLAGLPFWIIGKLLATFFVIVAVREEWKEEMNKGLYILFITFLITTIIVGILFGLTCGWYLPETTVTKWVN